MIITYKLVVYNSFSIHPLMTLASKPSNDYRFSLIPLFIMWTYYGHYYCINIRTHYLMLNAE